MFYRLTVVILLSFFVSTPTQSQAEIFEDDSIEFSDDSNYSLTRSSHNGKCYAKSVPSGKKGSRGSTKVYRVGSGKDRLIYSFKWYSREVAVHCDFEHKGKRSVSVVRIGDLHPGDQASSKHVELAFYLNGKLVGTHSALDVARKPANVLVYADQYSPRSGIKGFRYDTGSGKWVLDYNRMDGRVLSFDLGSGQLIN